MSLKLRILNTATIASMLVLLSGCSKPEPYTIDLHLATGGYSFDGANYFTSKAKSSNKKSHFEAKVYQGDVIANRYSSEHTTKYMTITPSDGIAEVAIYLQMNDPDKFDFATIIICDNDFRKAYPDAWIHWDKNFSENSRLTYSEEPQKGIYAQSVVNTPKQSESNAAYWGIGFSGIMLTEMTPKQVAAREEQGMIVIYK